MPAAAPAHQPDPHTPPTPVGFLFTHHDWRMSIIDAFTRERAAGTIPHIDTKPITLIAAHFSARLPYDTFEGSYSPVTEGSRTLYAHAPATQSWSMTPAIAHRSLDLLCAAGFLATLRARQRGTPGRYRMAIPPGARVDLPALLEAAAALGIKPTGRSRDTTAATAHRKAKAHLRREGVEDPIISGENPVDDAAPQPSARSCAHDRPDGDPQNRPHGHAQDRPDGDHSPYREVGEWGDGEGRWAGTTSGTPERQSGVRPIGRLPRRRPYDDALLRWRDAPTA